MAVATFPVSMAYSKFKDKTSRLIQVGGICCQFGVFHNERRDVTEQSSPRQVRVYTNSSTAARTTLSCIRESEHVLENDPSHQGIVGTGMR